MSARAPAATESRPQARTILIVEDTEFFQEMLRDALKGQYRTLCASTTKEAVALLGKESVDLLILDLALEGDDDGLDVLTVASHRSLPSLIFTARNESDLWGDGWEDLRSRGASDLLLKGIHIEEQLLIKVGQLLRSPRY